MIRSFSDKETAAFWATGKSKKIAPSLHQRVMDKLQILDAATEIENLRYPPSNNLEKLSGDLKGLWSIRINKQYRIIFCFANGCADDVALVDYH